MRTSGRRAAATKHCRFLPFLPSLAGVARTPRGGEERYPILFIVKRDQQLIGSISSSCLRVQVTKKSQAARVGPRFQRRARKPRRPASSHADGLFSISPRCDQVSSLEPCGANRAVCGQVPHTDVANRFYIMPSGRNERTENSCVIARPRRPLSFPRRQLRLLESIDGGAVLFDNRDMKGTCRPAF